MHFDGVALQNFRNYLQKSFLFPKQTTIIVGKNAAGKTSIIEAIALLSTGNSFRAEEVEEMIRFTEEISRVKSKITHNDEVIEQEVLLTRGHFNGKSVQSRLYSVNDVRRRKKDFAGNFFTVVFRPEDMRLVEGSPSRRRHFIDTILTVTDPEYAQSLKEYEQGLVRRNRILSQVQEGTMPRTVLSFWNALLLKHGQILQEKRREFFSTFSSVDFPMEFFIEYQPSIINEERMQQYAEKEIIVGHTFIGPHKDDFTVLYRDHQISLFGSRGQQRLAVLWLKMCELSYVTNQTTTQPILLLDDIFSELDDEHRDQVVKLMQDRQTIMTTTEEKSIAAIQLHIQDIDVIYV